MVQKKIGIFGASGFTGLELIRVLSDRHDIELCVLSSRSLAGTPVYEAFPEITLRKDLVFCNTSPQECEKMNLDLVFLALENGKAMEIVPFLSCKIIDLSADFRFIDQKKWERVYEMIHACPQKKAIYGLPELFSSTIENASLVANPGCFATASLLATIPFQHEKNIERIVYDGKTGISGAGRKNTETNNYNFLSDNVIPYKITNHRHEPEIQQFFTQNGKNNFPISFTPHIVPMMRGMLVTAHIFWKPGTIPSREEIIEKYEDFYKNFPLLEITKNTLPEPRQVRGTNRCRIGGFETDENGRLVIVSVIDNLGKGASLQAIQNMDLMLKEKGL